MRITTLTLSLLAASLAHAGDKVGYNNEVRPILSDKCYACHGPDETNNKAGLRLDTPEAAYAALKESKGHAIVPGDLAKSEAWQRIISDDPEKVMPTPESNLSLSDSEKDIIKRWIEQGAEYEPHWSFVNLPDQVEVPAEGVKNDWIKTPVDNFVSRKHASAGVEPSPEADPLVWLRRVTFDLTGLPPTVEDIDAFTAAVAEKGREQAFPEVIDRLLASDEYAEHMALDWLDTARYADTFGYHSDMDFTPWPYRDWVVKTFKEDMPYNKFVTENLAGDLLPDATRDQRLATAFNRLHRITNEGGSNYLEFFVDGVADRVNTVGTAFLGLTMECAKCHDHKYDPITQADYFKMFAFFNSINETGVYNHGAISPPPSLLLPTPDQEKDYESRKNNLAQVKDRLAKLKDSERTAFEAWKKQLASQKDAEFTIADQTSYFPLDQTAKKPLESVIQPAEERVVYDKRKKKDVKVGPLRAKHQPPRGAGQPPKYVDGPEGLGTAVALDGDRGLIIDEFMKIERYTPFSVSLYLKDVARMSHQATVIQRTHGHDVGYNGLDLTIKDGHLTARCYRSWPDNGIGIRTVEPIPQDQWAHLTWTWDGSGTHDGMSLYLDGKKVATENLGDKLYKSVNIGTYQKPGRFMIGAIFRGRGFKDGQVDEIKTFDRALTPLEAKALVEQIDLAEAAADASQDDDFYQYWLENYSESYRKGLADLAAAYKAVVKREDSFLEIPTMVEMEKPRPAYVLARGDFDAPRTEEVRVQRDSPGFLLPFPEDAPRDRLGFAQWLTQPNHPLLTRVYVNRIWQQMFGTGLVGTAENFGLQGDLPTHPELLDWLCRDFIENGWSTKHLIRNIVLSATYRQKSSLTPELQSSDIDNKLLARGPSHRLTGEQIRDAALASSGLLQKKAGGPPVRPYDPVRNKKPKANQVYFRSLYTYWRRTRPQNNMIIFDKPSLEVCSIKRTRTNSPAQALVLLNDTQFVEAARGLATKLLQSGKSDADQLKHAWKQVTSREPSPTEFQILTDILADQQTYFGERVEEAKKLLKVGLSEAPADLDPVQLAAMTVACQAIYNTDAAIWKR